MLWFGWWARSGRWLGSCNWRFPLYHLIFQFQVAGSLALAVKDEQMNGYGRQFYPTEPFLPFCSIGTMAFFVAVCVAGFVILGGKSWEVKGNLHSASEVTCRT